MKTQFISWLKARMAEGSSRRALAVLVTVLALTHVLDARDIGMAADSINQLGLFLLALDSFLTPQKTS